ncbi:hypothetical protein Tco_0875977 [Tanacetum coccineum]|uniref:Uncharacterized protein n=1 Tax=Tanacetum coccineum TaxID=301880 RepID=A0ABQ5BQZ3_9ASTR
MVVQNQAELGKEVKEKDTQVPSPSGPTNIVADKAVHKELGDSLVRAATTASSLEAEQDSGNITKTRSKATPNESSSLGTTSGGGPRCQETMGDTIAQTRFENVSKLSNDPLLARGNTLRSGEDSLKQKEIMELCTNLQTRVLDLEKTKTTQQNEITSLKRKKLEQKKRSKTHGLKRLYKVGLGARVESSGDKEYLVNVQDDAKMFDVNTLASDEVFVEQEVAAKDVNLTVDEVTLAQELTALKSVKPKDKGKGKMVKPEPMKPTKKKVQIMLDKEIALKLQADIDEEERIAKAEEEKIDEANITWDDIQAKVDADYQLAKRLQAEEQEQFTIKEKATLFKELLEKKRKHFAAKRAEEKRNKPPTKTQQKKTMITYLKNMEDLVEGSLKRAGEELKQESTKKQKVDEDKDTTKLQSLMEVIPDEEEVAIDVVPLATKPPTIVDWKIHKEGKKSYYQIARVDGKSQILRINKVFGSILLVIMKLLMKKLDDFGDKYQVYGRIVGIKSLLNAVSIHAALIDVNVAQSKLYKVNAVEGVNAASEEVSTAELVRVIKKWTKIKAKTDKAKHEKERVYKSREFLAKKETLTSSDMYLVYAGDPMLSDWLNIRGEQWTA